MDTYPATFKDQVFHCHIAALMNILSASNCDFKLILLPESNTTNINAKYVPRAVHSSHFNALISQKLQKNTTQINTRVQNPNSVFETVCAICV